MAVFHCHHYSENLQKRTMFDVTIPDRLPEGEIPVVYLLHGLGDDQSMWQRYTRVEKYAADYGLVVIMPNGEKSFYTDMKYGWPYYTYIAEEIIDYVRRIFNFSTSREKTFVCGNSMGGYGAFKLALSRPDVFGKAVSLSGALDMVAHTKEELFDEVPYHIWGENYSDVIKDSKDDLMHLAREVAQSDGPKPKMLQICGTSDFLYKNNISFKNLCESLPLDYRYMEGEGGHGWDFWDQWLPTAFRFFADQL